MRSQPPLMAQMLCRSSTYATMLPLVAMCRYASPCHKDSKRCRVMRREEAQRAAAAARAWRMIAHAHARAVQARWRVAARRRRRIRAARLCCKCHSAASRCDRYDARCQRVPPLQPDYEICHFDFRFLQSAEMIAISYLLLPSLLQPHLHARGS